MLQRLQVADAGRSFDPTGTAGIRRVFRGDAASKARAVRARLQDAVSRLDVLGLGVHGTSPMTMHAGDTRVAAFKAYLDYTVIDGLVGDWPRQYVERSWYKGMSDARAEVNAPPMRRDAGHLVELSKAEIKGIAEAAIQRCVRAAADAIGRRMTPQAAAREVLRAFDAVTLSRLKATANVSVVQAYNHGKLEVYEDAGIKAVGVAAEVLPAFLFRHSHTTDAKKRERLVGVLTAGDNVVCERCEDYAEDSPHYLSEAKAHLPMHPNCRCTVYPWSGGNWGDELPKFEEAKHPRGFGGMFREKPGDPYERWAQAHKSQYGLVPGDAEKFKKLKAEWAIVNNELLEHVDDPDGPECRAALQKLEGIVHQIHGLHADPGGPAGIGLPGGPLDVAIVGGGPGGLAAGINGAAEGLETAVIEANVVAGGQAKFSSRIENFPGFPVGVTGERLTQNMFTQAKRLGAQTKLGVRVTGMAYDPSTGLKHLTLSNGEEIASRTVIMAGGLEFRRLQFPGSDGSGVIVGDGKTLAKEGSGGGVCVIGGSNGAAQAALGCARTADHVYVLARSPIVDSMSDYQVEALRANPKITVIESDQIAKLWRDDHGNPQSVETAKGKTFPVKALGLFLGSVPDTKWVPSDIKIVKGRVQTNADLETSLPGVYAIGDLRDGAIGRVGVAVGEGQLALRQANLFLEKQKVQTDSADAQVFRRAPADVFVESLFALDLANPWFGQTIEDVDPLTADAFPQYQERQHPRGFGGKWRAKPSAKPSVGGGDDDELGSMALGGEDRNITSATRAVDALRDAMGVTELPMGERQALDMYTADSYPFNQIERAHRGGPVSVPTQYLDKLVNGHKLPHAVTVYRTVGWQRTKDILSHADGSFSDPGYMSTTLDKSKIDKPGSYIEIQVPEGSAGFPVGSLSNYPEEAEILFPRNSRLQIISHEARDAPNTMRFVARLIP